MMKRTVSSKIEASSFFLGIKNKLAQSEINIYQAVDLVRGKLKLLLPVLKKELLTGETPYFRLFAAWCLGAAEITDNQHILEKAYFLEKDNNARANIVWAYFRSGGNNKSMLSLFLDDSYFLIRLMVLKNIKCEINVLNMLSIHQLIRKDEHPLIRIESLRKAYLFGDNEKELLTILSKILLHSNGLLEIDACLQSISKFRCSHSSRVLHEFFRKREKMIVANKEIAFAFCIAISELNESSEHPMLLKLYFEKVDRLVKQGIVEALAVGGGPDSLTALKEIASREADKKIKKFVKILIANTEITEI